MGVMKRLFIGWGRAEPVCPQAGMKLIANQGPVAIQAQNDQLQLLAPQDLEIVSTDSEIHIVAKKKIIINAEEAISPSIPIGLSSVLAVMSTSKPRIFL